MDLETTLAQGTLDGSFPLPPDTPFTYATAIAAGLSRHTLRVLVEARVLRRPVKGVYVAAALPDSLSLRAACLALVVPPDAVVVDRHAGWLLGAEMVLAPGEHLDLRPLSLFRPAGHGRCRNDLSRSGERNLRPDDICELNGLRVTTPLRTAWDLGRVRWTDEAITGLDAMFRLRVFERDEFLAGIRRFRGMRWVRTLRAIGPLADPRAESPPESVLRLRCIELGLTKVEPQVEVWDDDRFLARLDLAERRRRFAFEYDGALWHYGPEAQERDARRRKRVAEDGWLVEVFRAEDVFGRSADCERRMQELVRAAETRSRSTRSA
ncbi:hypothetical protein GHK92_04185 [Nocardioides sp. dk4132]|uniref:hypothetical protein n=1 Tax=unclassified Nocardioides TaxID=2615069 RepID=UPI001297653F|nr:MULTISPECIES: hypothetical protein [unclassified Nocardioides]MQW75062.1 hypothetical protein [Nocardioides sp. dk4132]QGA07766.1 hypothetical protein GFH29_10425 [Nocardioides sp. dk884]